MLGPAGEVLDTSERLLIFELSPEIFAVFQKRKCNGTSLPFLPYYSEFNLIVKSPYRNVCSRLQPLHSTSVEEIGSLRA